MPEQTRIWTIGESDSLVEINPSRLDQELRIQNWVEKDISIISNDLLVIGREVPTDYNGYIDILCLDSQGDLVILELKRDKTPREVTAQALDYASWVKDLSHNDITEIAESYIEDGKKLEYVFQNKFGEPLPEILNNNHRMVIIGSRIDDSTERIMNYLSETYGIGINAVTFTFYEHEGIEYLSRNTLIEEAEAAAQHAKYSRSKRKPVFKLEDFKASIRDERLRDMFSHAVTVFSSIFDGRVNTRSTVSFTGLMDGSKNTIFAIEPFESNSEEGLAFYLYYDRSLTYFNMDDNKLTEIFGSKMVKDELWDMENGIRRGKFTSIEQIDFVAKKLEGLR